MEIRKIYWLWDEEDTITYTLLLGNISTQLRQRASELSGKEYPPLYADVIKNKADGTLTVASWPGQEDAKRIIYTLDKEGKKLPLAYKVSSSSIEEMTNMVKEYIRNIENGWN